MTCRALIETATASLPGQIRVDPSTQIIVVEGNYLLLDRSPWRDLQGFYAATVFVCAPRTVLRERLMARWNDQNLSEQEGGGEGCDQRPAQR